MLKHNDDIIDATRIHQQLTTHTLGRTLHIHAVTTSTNDDVRHAAQHGTPEGLVVVADHQTQGRGQRGRTWHDTPHAQLMCSLLLRPAPLESQHATYFVNALVLVLAETIATYVTAPVTLKWPNDILIDTRKVAGVIGEARIRDRHVDSLCIGCGINVHTHPTTTVDGVDLSDQSTAITPWAHQPIDRTDILIRLLNAFEPVYAQLQHDPTAYHARWYAAMCHIIGQTRTIRTGAQTIHGMVHAINPDGSIVIDGHTVYAGIMHVY